MKNLAAFSLAALLTLAANVYAVDELDTPVYAPDTAAVAPIDTYDTTLDSTVPYTTTRESRTAQIIAIVIGLMLAAMILAWAMRRRHTVTGDTIYRDTTINTPYRDTINTPRTVDGNVVNPARPEI